MKRHAIRIGVGAALSAVVLVTGCSSSSSSSSAGTYGGSQKAKSCKNDKVSAGDPNSTCNTCESSEMQLAAGCRIGSDPNAFGGACGDFYQCYCDCASTDSACLASCVPKETQACKDAIVAGQTCEQSNCSAECAKDGG